MTLESKHPIRIWKESLLGIGLLCIPLFIYLFYRTDRTVITHFARQLFGADAFYTVRKGVQARLPLSSFWVYSLPELIWVFVSTRLAWRLYFKLGHRQIGCVWVPLVFSLGLEIAQGTGLVRGRFDLWDCGAVLLGWGAGRQLYSPAALLPQRRLLPLNGASSAFLLCFSSVFLAHVWA